MSVIHYIRHTIHSPVYYELVSAVVGNAVCISQIFFYFERNKIGLLFQTILHLCFDLVSHKRN